MIRVHSIAEEQEGKAFGRSLLRALGGGAQGFQPWQRYGGSEAFEDNAARSRMSRHGIGVCWFH
ncbi:MAG: hypothetical protein EBR81_17550 [Proteobacteria bacterium]|nr:hypothetical protein [Pseudomonadota bacterium]